MRVPTMLTEVDELPSIKLGEYELRLEMETLNENSAAIAEKELRETPEIKAKAIEDLKKLLKEETDLITPDFEDWLVRFLRPCKFYPESARDLIKRYFAFKIKHSDVYENLMPSNETNIFRQNILTVMPNRDQSGRRILLMELGKNWNYKEVSLDEVFKGSVLFLEAALLEPETQVHGSVVIFDMNGLSLQQTWQFTPQFAKRIVDWLQDCVPLRVKAIHVINQPKLFNIVFALFKPFLREKLRSRIHFHSTDRESLHKHLSAKCLPPIYGGTIDIPRINGDDWFKLLLKCDQEYEAINALGYKNDGKSKKKNKK